MIGMKIEQAQKGVERRKPQDISWLVVERNRQGWKFQLETSAQILSVFENFKIWRENLFEWLKLLEAFVRPKPKSTTVWQLKLDHNWSILITMRDQEQCDRGFYLD